MYEKFKILYRCTFLDEWFYDESDSVFKFFELPKKVSQAMKDHAKKQIYEQGTGRHAEEEVIHIARLDIESVSRCIGKFI